MKRYSTDRNGSGTGDDWTVDLGDMISRQTMREAGMQETDSAYDEDDSMEEERSDGFGFASKEEGPGGFEFEFESEEDAVLFDELLEEESASGPDRSAGRQGSRRRSSGRRGNRRQEAGSSSEDEWDDGGGRRYGEYRSDAAGKGEEGNRSYSGRDGRDGDREYSGRRDAGEDRVSSGQNRSSGRNGYTSRNGGEVRYSHTGDGSAGGDDEGRYGYSGGEEEEYEYGYEEEEPVSRKESRKEKRAARKEEKEYEEFKAWQKGKKRRKRHRLRKALIIIAVVVLLLYALGTIALRLLGIQTSLSGISSSFNDGVSGNSSMSGYTNIALFGVDSRDEDLGEGNRTDVMIIASINNLTGDIQLVSVYRDTYLDIGDGDYQKANAAYAYGGAEQAISMLNKNLDLNITDYVTIGFVGVADLIDTVGGVEITVTEEEISHLNNYQLTMAEQMGVSYTEVTTAGTQTLNGLQAVAYCRIRYTDGGDFQRTERQKAVLSAVFAKLKASGPLTILQAAAALSDEIETSLSTAEIASLAMRVFMYEIADTSGFPNEDLRTTGYIGDASCVIPITLSANVTWLHEYLFGDTDYEPSETVQTISAYISSVSGYY